MSRDNASSLAVAATVAAALVVFRLGSSRGLITAPVQAEAEPGEEAEANEGGTCKNVAGSQATVAPSAAPASAKVVAPVVPMAAAATSTATSTATATATAATADMDVGEPLTAAPLVHVLIDERLPCEVRTLRCSSCRLQLKLVHGYINLHRP